MKISYCRYELESHASLNSKSQSYIRPGALLKVSFEEGLIGYADCHAWPELGDCPLEKQLDLLATGKLTPITRQALKWAKIDAEARAESRAILSPGQIPKSHFLLSDICNCTAALVKTLIEQEYSHVKIKVGRQIDLEIEKLVLFAGSSLQLRLDFNESLTPLAFRNFLQHIDELKAQIDFIEDPFPFEYHEWKSFQERGWQLACDRQATLAINYPEAARILIIKPAIQSLDNCQLCADQGHIVTSYLGHPLGQLTAAAVAAKLDPANEFVHGLLSHGAYAPTAFSRHLNWHGPSFNVPPGVGFGFDHELQKLEWSLLL